MNLTALAQQCVQIAIAAGHEVMAVYGSPTIAHESKADSSPLTEADRRAHRSIVGGLGALVPALPVLSEEAADVPWAERARWPRYWLVDPLDGTKEFLSRNDEFTVNIALIDGHAAALGVVHVPATGVTYWGITSEPERGAWKRSAAGDELPIRVAATPAIPLRVLGSRSHRGATLESFLNRVGEHRLIAAGSALKFCVLAEGAADVYPRLSPTSEWDTAAGQAVVEGAGGYVTTLDGNSMRYGTRDSLLNPHFIAYANCTRNWADLAS